MTQPGPQGYPDWQRVSSRANTLYTDTLFHQGFNDGTLAPIFVGNQPAIGLYCNLSSGTWNIKFEFYDDVNLTTFLGRHEFDFYTGAFFLRCSVPVLGPWLSIVATATVAATDIRVRVSATAQASTYADRGYSNILSLSVANAIGAGATLSRTGTYLWPGAAFLNYQMATQASILQLDCLDAFGGIKTFWKRNLVAGAKVGEMIALPSGTVVARVTNSGGVADTFDLFLTGLHQLMGA